MNCYVIAFIATIFIMITPSSLLLRTRKVSQSYIYLSGLNPILSSEIRKCDSNISFLEFKMDFHGNYNSAKRQKLDKVTITSLFFFAYN